MTNSKSSSTAWGWPVLALIIVGLAFCAGCASSVPDLCSTCPPRVETQIIKQPIPCVLLIGLLEPLILPDSPGRPDFTTATDDEIDAWLADLRAAIDGRDALQTARIEALKEQIATHNSLEPRCTEIE